MPVFEYACTFAHGSYTNGEIDAKSEDEAKVEIENEMNADHEPEYRFGTWLCFRLKVNFPPIEKLIQEGRITV